MRETTSGFFKRGLLFFLKIFPGPPFALFQKMRVLGDLEIIAITWQFGHSLSRCLQQNRAQSLHFKSILAVSNEAYFLGDF